MIIPINGYIQIEPVEHEEFMATAQTTYDEVGVVVSTAYDGVISFPPRFDVGDKVYFDSWLASKYPKGNNEYYWLVKYEDIRAYEKAIPKE